MVQGFIQGNTKTRLTTRDQPESAKNLMFPCAQSFFLHEGRGRPELQQLSVCTRVVFLFGLCVLFCESYFSPIKKKTAKDKP